MNMRKWFIAALLAAVASAAHAHAQTLGGGFSKPPWCAYSFKTMLALGDSTTDTGNYVHSIAGTPKVSAASFPPYGETYFGEPTGRFSDGRMMVDVVAQALHHALLPPHIGAPGAGNLTEGSQNFAVAGATALGEEELARVTGGAKAATPLSLEKQVSMVLESRVEAGAFVFVGEIGGNDYNYAFAQGMTAERVIEMVAEVVEVVEVQLERLLSGQPNVTKMVVLGQFPLGCISSYLTEFGEELELDEHGCVAEISAVTDLHDSLLKASVEKLRERHRGAVQIVFFNLGRAYLDVLDHAAGFGFEETVQPCHRQPPALGANATTGATCINPAAFMSWDGRHLTDAMHRTLVSLMLYSYSLPPLAFPFPNFLTPCT